MSSPAGPPQAPGLPWRASATSSLIMGVTGAASKAFLFGLNRTEVHGLQRFLDLLDSRQDPQQRERGLITVSNHLSVLDDPIMWGVLPLSYMFNPLNLRWGLGAHDICFKNKFLASFFTHGQVLPTHRLNHSAHGGLFQPTVTQAIRLLSARPDATPAKAPGESTSSDSLDPFTAGSLTYTTDGLDSVPAPWTRPQNRRAWVHIFPEGAVHQHPSVDMKYFKWGISRLILESDPTPDVVPVFIDGNQHLMPEDRKFLRFLPRVGARIQVAFGEKLDAEETFGDLKRRWERLVSRSRAIRAGGKEGDGSFAAASAAESSMGELPDDLKYGEEAREIRAEVARRVREQVLELRRELRYPEPDPSFAYAETWAKEPNKKRYRSQVDDSWINQD